MYKKNQTSMLKLPDILMIDAIFKLSQE